MILFGTMNKFRDFEKEHRERVLAYQHKNAEQLRIQARNKYRLKHNIPIDAPIKNRRPVVYV